MSLASSVIRSGVHGGDITSLISASSTSRNRSSRHLRLLHDLRASWTCGTGQRHLDIDFSVISIDRIDEPQIHNVDHQLRVDDLLQRLDEPDVVVRSRFRCRHVIATGRHCGNNGNVTGDNDRGRSGRSGHGRLEVRLRLAQRKPRRPGSAPRTSESVASPACTRVCRCSDQTSHHVADK